MGRLKNSDDPYMGLNEPDPYLEIEAEEPSKPRAKSAADDFTPRKPKEKTEAGFDPSLNRALLAALKALPGKIADLRGPDPKPPIVNVEAPIVKIPETKIVMDKHPRKWRVRVTERDADGLIKDLTITAVD